MKRTNPVESLASAVYTALADKEILPDVKLEHRSIDRMVRPSVSDVDIYHFPQMWGSTALGFGGIGGAAMTTAYTTVIISKNVAAVFFDGRHAYCIDDFNEKLMEDIKKHSIASLSNAGTRYDCANHPSK